MIVNFLSFLDKTPNYAADQEPVQADESGKSSENRKSRSAENKESDVQDSDNKSTEAVAESGGEEKPAERDPSSADEEKADGDQIAGDEMPTAAVKTENWMPEEVHKPDDLIESSPKRIKRNIDSDSQPGDAKPCEQPKTLYSTSYNTTSIDCFDFNKLISYNRRKMKKDGEF